MKRILTSICLAATLLTVEHWLLQRKQRYCQNHHIHRYEVRSLGIQDCALAQEEDLVAGYPDGIFKPNQHVSEVEFLTMFLRGYVEL